MSRLEQIQKMLKEDPRDTFLNFGLAMEYVKAGRSQEAVAQFERVIEFNPDEVAAYFQQGKTLVALGRIDQAKTALAQGIAAAERLGNTHAVAEMNELLTALG